MASQEYSTVEHLAEVFERCQEEIIDEWRLQTGELLRELNLDKPTITNHLPDDVAEITRDLAKSPSGAKAKEICGGKKAAGRGPGMGEMVLSGFW